MAIISGFRCSSSRVVEFGWKSYTIIRAVVSGMSDQKVVDAEKGTWNYGGVDVQLSLKALVVKASRRLTTFGCFICLHFSIAEKASWLETLYPDYQYPVLSPEFRV
jgi:hypothetical protein